MTQSYLKITPGLARQIRIIVADVDGTLISSGDSFSPDVVETIRLLENSGYMVGFASGRTLSRLEPLAAATCISGPIIAENGCVVKLERDTDLFDSGYSRQPALKAFMKLKSAFGQAIREAEDNTDRLIDVGFYCDDIAHDELIRNLEGVQLLDSGYMLHLQPEGVNKGRTLMMLLKLIGDGTLRPDEVMVFGDSATDVSLFEAFENSVLIGNPRLSPKQTREIRGLAKYRSELPFGDGFIQVSRHILNS